jgi:hypothetical protein
MEFSPVVMPAITIFVVIFVFSFSLIGVVRYRMKKQMAFMRAQIKKLKDSENAMPQAWTDTHTPSQEDIDSLMQTARVLAKSDQLINETKIGNTEHGH